MKALYPGIRTVSHKPARVTQNEDRLLPVLLDRLTDDKPGSRQENIEQNFLSGEHLKKAVLRDLAWLLNTISFDSSQSIDQFPYVKKSSFNFGINALAGKKMSEIEPEEIERGVWLAIRNYEPRLISHELSVTCIREETTLEHYNILFLVIRGMLWCNPYPIEFYVKTEIDLESGRIEMSQAET